MHFRWTTSVQNNNRPKGHNINLFYFAIDLRGVSSLIHFELFADDSNVVILHKSHENLFQIMNFELPHLGDWFKTNTLSLNLTKTFLSRFLSRARSLSFSLFFLSLFSLFSLSFLSFFFISFLYLFSLSLLSLSFFSLSFLSFISLSFFSLFFFFFLSLFSLSLSLFSLFSLSLSISFLSLSSLFFHSLSLLSLSLSLSLIF